MMQRRMLKKRPKNERESKEESFDRVKKSSSSLDRVLECFGFRKHAYKLLPPVGNDLLELVRRELEIDSALSTRKLETKIASGEGTPILDAVGAKMGISLANIVAPPIKSCRICRARTGRSIMNHQRWHSSQ